MAVETCCGVCPSSKPPGNCIARRRGLLALDVRWQVGRSDQMCDKIVALTSRQDAMANPESSMIGYLTVYLYIYDGMYMLRSLQDVLVPDVVFLHLR